MSLEELFNMLRAAVVGMEVVGVEGSNRDVKLTLQRGAKRTIVTVGKNSVTGDIGVIWKNDTQYDLDNVPYQPESPEPQL